MVVNKKLKTYYKKYNDGKIYFNVCANISDSALDNLKYWQVKNELKKIEKALAMSPDSLNYDIDSIIYSNNVKKEEIDSFFLNKNKIKYIKKNNIKSKNIIFL